MKGRCFKYLVMMLFLSASLLTACGGGGGATTPAAVDTTAPTTIFSLAGGTYSGSQTVTITANEAATIYYTIDGTAPTTASTVYSGAISITADTTLKCFAVDSAGNSGSVKTENYVITTATDITAPTTTAVPAGGTYNSTQSVTFTASETATIYYTTDGSAPTTASTVYSTAISIAADTTLKFFAKDTAGNSETVKTETYVIDTTAPTITFKSPAASATGVAVNATISVTFSEAIDTSTLTISTFTVNNGVTGTIAFSGGNTIATFTPSSSLASNTAYTVNLATGITDIAGNAITATSWSFTTIIATPAGLTASAGNTLNTISWSAVSGAASYNLYYGTTSGVTISTGTKITGVTSPYSHTGLTNGTAYYYIATAVNAGGESAPSSEVSATPIAVTVRKVPDTGQTTKYSTAFGDDSDYTINPPSYTDNGDGTITDNVTGLMWQKCSNGQTGADCSGGSAGTYNWYKAVGTADATYNPGGATNVCGSLTTGGYSDWRLPNPFELMLIADNEIFNPAINSAYFPSTVSSRYWSATTSASNTSYAWYVYFYSGSVYFINKSYYNYVRCVR